MNLTMLQYLLIFIVLPLNCLSFIYPTNSNIFRTNRIPSTCSFQKSSSVVFAKSKEKKSSVDEKNGDESEGKIEAEIVNDEDIFQYDNDDDDWLPDKEKAKRIKQRQQNMKSAGGKSPNNQHYESPKPPGVHIDDINITPSKKSSTSSNKKRLEYTEEEEDLIQALGGKDGPSSSNKKREDGFLGDSTLKEIASDFQVPICYIADVLCMWGVPAPIDVNARLGDMVTGEQAFALLEAIHTLDLGALNERYSDMDLMTLCAEYEIELKDGFDFVVKEGYSLPFGVRTFLRVEQEDELIRTLSKEDWM